MLAVAAFILSAVAPVTVGAGVVPTAFAVTGVVGLPLVFLVVVAVLGVFAVGYLAMARRLPGAGAFYVFVARGLGRPAGVAAAWVALAGYNVLQIGLYGAVGAAVAPLTGAWFGWPGPWWLWALAAWALVTVVGVRRVDQLGRVLGVVVCCELVVLLVFAASNLLHPAGGSISVEALSVSALAQAGTLAGFALGVVAFTGFEAGVVFSAESRNPARTVPAATYLALGVMAVVYAVSAWSDTVAAGPGQVVGRAQAEGPELVFGLASAQLGSAAGTVGRLLFVTSLLAALLSFHAAVTRYLYSIALDGVLPRGLARVNPRTGAPVVASRVQNALGLVVIGVYVAAGWDPLVQLFFYAGGIGGLSILLLLVATSAAVLVWFARHPDGEPVWRRLLAPLLAATALLVMLGCVLTNLDALLGVPAGHPLLVAVPVALAVLVVLGIGWALILRAVRPDVYAGIARGGLSRPRGTPAGAEAGPARAALGGGDDTAGVRR